MTKPIKQRKPRDRERTRTRDLPTPHENRGQFVILHHFNDGSLLELLIEEDGSIHSMTKPESEKEFWKEAKLGTVYSYEMNRYEVGESKKIRGQLIHIVAEGSKAQENFERQFPKLMAEIDEDKVIPYFDRPPHTKKKKKKEEKKPVLKQKNFNAQFDNLDKISESNPIVLIPDEPEIIQVHHVNNDKFTITIEVDPAEISDVQILAMEPPEVFRLVKALKEMVVQLRK